MKSSNKHDHQILGVLSEKRAKAFLLDCANLRYTPQDQDAAFLRLHTRYPDIVSDPALYTEQVVLISTFGFLSFLLRQGWDAPTLRGRAWYFHDAESLCRLTTEAVGVWMDHHELPESSDRHPRITYYFTNPPTHATPLEAAFHYLGQQMEHALHCANPECPAPYFFATKKNQQYCSPECAEPARRASKLRWWNANRAGKPKIERGKNAKAKKA
jgi:hypothetical protein